MIMNRGQKGFINIVIVIIAIIVISGAIEGYLILTKKPEPTTQKTETTKQQTEIKDKTANWQTYTNNKYNYSIKHPPQDWKITSTSDDNVLIGSTVFRKNQPEGGASILIKTTKQSLSEYIAAYEKEDPLINKIKSQVQTTFAGKIATELVLQNALGLDTNVYFISNNNNFIINYLTTDNIHKQIISTFKFTK